MARTKSLFEYVLETAPSGAVSGGNIAMSAPSLFSGSVITRDKRIKKNRMKKPLFSKYTKEECNFSFKDLFGLLEDSIKKEQNNRSKLLFDVLYKMSDGVVFESEGDESFNQSDVIARLGNVAKQTASKEKRYGTTFGLEDDDGNLVKIVVKSEQAKEFEQALNHYLEKIEREHSNIEVGEILHELKDRFGIIDVKWPNIEEDEEEIKPSESEDDINNDNKTLDNDEMAPNPDENSPDSPEAISLLQQVIDLLSKQAEADKAEAEAKKTEAEAKAQTLSVKQAMDKVKQQEELLDMEEFERAKKDEEKEIKRLAQLARYKKRLNGGDDLDELDDYYSNQDDKNSDGRLKANSETDEQSKEESNEDEEVTNPKMLDRTLGGRISIRELGDIILRRTK